jgi:UDP-glucose 4-epimerase
VVGIFMKNALAGEPLPIFSDGSQTRSFTYISGVAKCLAEAPFVDGARNQIFNIGTDERMSVKDLAGHICRILGVREDLVFLPARQEVIHAHADHSRVRNVFPKVLAECPGVVDGLAVTAEYVKSHPIPKITECPSGIEIFDRLPPSWAARFQARRA